MSFSRKISIPEQMSIINFYNKYSNLKLNEAGVCFGLTRIFQDYIKKFDINTFAQRLNKSIPTTKEEFSTFEITDIMRSVIIKAQAYQKGSEETLNLSEIADPGTIQAICAVMAQKESEITSPNQTYIPVTNPFSPRSVKKILEAIPSQSQCIIAGSFFSIELIKGHAIGLYKDENNHFYLYNPNNKYILESNNAKEVTIEVIKSLNFDKGLSLTFSINNPLPIEEIKNNIHQLEEIKNQFDDTEKKLFRDRTSRSYLFYDAIQINDISFVRYLHANDLINSAELYFATYVAGILGRDEILDFILETFPKSKISLNPNILPFIDKKESIDLIIKHNALNVASFDKYGNNILHHTFRSNKKEIIESILNYFVKNAPTFIEYMTEVNNKEIKPLDLLLNSGIDTVKKVLEIHNIGLALINEPVFLHTIMQLKNRRHKIELIQLLTNYQTNFSLKDANKKSILFYACKENDYEIIKILLNANVSCQKALQNALRKKNEGLVIIFLQYMSIDNFTKIFTLLEKKNDNESFFFLESTAAKLLNGTIKLKTPLFGDRKNILIAFANVDFENKKNTAPPVKFSDDLSRKDKKEEIPKQSNELLSFTSSSKLSMFTANKKNAAEIASFSVAEKDINKTIVNYQKDLKTKLSRLHVQLSNFKNFQIATEEYNKMFASLTEQEKKYFENYQIHFQNGNISLSKNQDFISYWCKQYQIANPKMGPSSLDNYEKLTTKRLDLFVKILNVFNKSGNETELIKKIKNEIAQFKPFDQKLISSFSKEFILDNTVNNVNYNENEQSLINQLSRRYKELLLQEKALTPEQSPNNSNINKPL